MVLPGGVAELVHPVKAVVVGVVVVDGAAGGAAKAEVDAGDAGVVLERGEIGARAHGTDAFVPEIENGLAFDSLVRGLHERCSFVYTLLE